MIWLLDQAVHEYAKTRETLTDHGSQFWSVRRGESSFDTYCASKGIKHILGGIGKPTTQGKIERWFRTYDLEHARFPFHRKFIQYYNYEADITIESNPYSYRLVPGKEAEAFVPSYLELLRLLSKLLAQENLLTKEDEMRIKNIESKLQALIEGKMVGNPRRTI